VKFPPFTQKAETNHFSEDFQLSPAVYLAKPGIKCTFRPKMIKQGEAWEAVHFIFDFQFN